MTNFIIRFVLYGFILLLPLSLPFTIEEQTPEIQSVLKRKSETIKTTTPVN